MYGPEFKLQTPPGEHGPLDVRLGPITAETLIEPSAQIDIVLSSVFEGRTIGRISGLIAQDPTMLNWYEAHSANIGWGVHVKEGCIAVSYTHLTLPTNREV